MTASNTGGFYKKTRILVKGEDKTESITAWTESFSKIDITYSNGKTYSYNRSNVRIENSALSDATALNRFEYLQRVADVIGLQDPRTGNILSNRYNKIDFVSEKSMLAAFLTGQLQYAEHASMYSAIYPFGFNISQKTAVDNALANPLTIIEGPPGTGKTQTILNIIANAVMHGESVAVVSANNSATSNVLEKLKKYKFDFIAAYLGNSENKSKFLAEPQTNILPDLSSWEITPELNSKTKKSIQNLYALLGEMLDKKNKFAEINQKLNVLKLEYEHFCAYSKIDEQSILQYLQPTNSATVHKLWFLCEKYIERGRMPGLFTRIVNHFLYGVKDKAFYSLPKNEVITICQKLWYMVKIEEESGTSSLLKKELDSFDFPAKMGKYTDLSVKLFRNELAKKYKDSKRNQDEIKRLWSNPEEFVAEFPVILSTAYSVCSSLASKIMYDYVIIDEASQVDIITGALALSCARKAVIVGDHKQLPNVVDFDSAQKTDAIFAAFNLPETYRYKNHSLLAAVSEIFPKAPRTLLREHYRCHPSIIEFCNQKFYDNQLIILTESKLKRQPLIVYKTAPGNHARERVNQRQIDVIKQEIIPQQSLDGNDVSVGIVTPYRNQTNALQQAFAGTGIQADTVDKFQGRERDVMILSTVDNQISEFTDNANRLNVALSRAIEQLIVVLNGGDDLRDTNIGDLVRYIEYNNLEIIQSEIYSVFDYLYKCYNEKRNELLYKHGRVSEYDSENLIYLLIRNVLQDKHFSSLDIAMHVPLRMILRDTSNLNEDEKRYAENILTHVDFLIFDKFGKVPRLALEVDGVAFHKEGTRQAERDKMKDRILERYNLPLIRLKTNESNERERLISKLRVLMKG